MVAEPAGAAGWAGLVGNAESPATAQTHEVCVVQLDELPAESVLVGLEEARKHQEVAAAVIRVLLLKHCPSPFLSIEAQHPAESEDAPSSSTGWSMSPY